MQERPPVCVTDCESLYDHLSAVGSPSTLQDKRSAIDVPIIRVSLKKTVGGWDHKREGRSSRMPGSQFNVWIACAPWRRASHAGEATVESEQEGSNREELDTDVILIGLRCVIFSSILVH